MLSEYSNNACDFIMPLACCIWKTVFTLSRPPPFVLKMFLIPFLHISIPLIIAGESKIHPPLTYG